MRFGAAAAMALVVACSAPSVGNLNTIELGPEERRPRSEPRSYGRRGERASLQELVKQSRKNARRKRRRRR